MHGYLNKENVIRTQIIFLLSSDWLFLISTLSCSEAADAESSDKLPAPVDQKAIIKRMLESRA